MGESEIARTLGLDNPADALTALRSPLQFLSEALSGLAAGGHQEFDFTPGALEGLAVICGLLSLLCSEALETLKK